ncbi:lipopolysaccharide ABC transporter, permease protein [Hyphomonas neptunium ATCC 15444]|uniref:Transport permease protein n=2 Tax=Hyphomonas TaxID=85 RepID=Q0C420_HYPNA|nr:MULTISPECIES: ABC transporter permease [Hyphomonas]ABI78549.1 lipopolysaccharide ABC transporter, permease protein [Hyphomonas neptunium ATCC 15444]KCZ96265.1 lipopolysaccharide ABC transporter permease [Hyphomonas hirschiana VP5]
MEQQIQSAWNYRHFILAAIRAEFKGRVARSKIGALWFVLHPLAIALIYALVLSEVLSAKLAGTEREGAYGIYLLAGISVWTIFSEVTNRCLNIFIEYSSAIKKINFPKIALPLIVLGGALFSHLLLLSAVGLIASFYGFSIQLAWLYLPIPLVLACLMAGGLGVCLGVLNVFSRDVSHVMSVAMNMWFWLTPIVYATNMLPEYMQSFIALNPMTGVVAAYQDIIVFGRAPEWQTLLYPLIAGVLFSALSLFIFRRASSELVDAL